MNEIDVFLISCRSGIFEEELRSIRTKWPPKYLNGGNKTLEKVGAGELKTPAFSAVVAMQLKGWGDFLTSEPPHLTLVRLPLILGI